MLLDMHKTAGTQTTSGCRLPLSERIEWRLTLKQDLPVPAQALCAWLEEQAAAGGRAAQALPVYYLLRGRIAEGLHANARLSREPPKDGAHVLLFELWALRDTLLPGLAAHARRPVRAPAEVGSQQTILN